MKPKNLLEILRLPEFESDRRALIATLDHYFGLRVPITLSQLDGYFVQFKPKPALNRRIVEICEELMRLDLCLSNEATDGWLESFRAVL